MINIQKLKAANAVTIETSEDGRELTLTINQYDALTGKRVNDLMKRYIRTTVESDIEVLTANLANAKALLAEFAEPKE